jgi:hypothetical protein
LTLLLTLLRLIRLAWLALLLLFCGNVPLWGIETVRVHVVGAVVEDARSLVVEVDVAAES